jgi:hypothetical protein
MRTQLCLWLCACIVSTTSSALAWDDFNSPEYKASLDPAWGVSPHSEGPPVRPPHRAFGAFDLGVPIVMNTDRDLVRPGANLHVTGGLDLGFVAFFLHGGFRAVPLDFDRYAKHGHPAYTGEGRDPLKNPYFGFGVKGQFPNRTRLLPYASVSFDFNFWNFRETEVSCGGYYYWWCDDYNVYRFTPGFTGTLGGAIYVARGFYVDLGLAVAMSFKGDFFDKSQWWLEPQVGVLHRM